MNITLKIEAPELVAAIQALAGSFGKSSVQVTPANVVLEPKTQENFATPASPQEAPIPQPVPAVPTNQYQTPPMQQPPVQQASVQQAPIAQPPQGVPTTLITYSMDQLAVAATSLVDAGKREDLLQLLASFGAQALTQLPKEQYGAFATKLREMGAKI
jgi:hypothetical protein